MCGRFGKRVPQYRFVCRQPVCQRVVLKKGWDVDADRLHIDGAQNQIFLGTAFEFDGDLRTVGKGMKEASHGFERMNFRRRI